MSSRSANSESSQSRNTNPLHFAGSLSDTHYMSKRTRPVIRLNHEPQRPDMVEVILSWISPYQNREAFNDPDYV